MQIPDAVIAAGAALFGLTTADLRLLGGMEGAAYEFSRDGRPFVLKIAPTPTEQVAKLDAEYRFVRYLAANGVRLSEPVDSVAGALVETADEETGDGKFVWAVTCATKAVGRHPTNRDASDLANPALVREWGRVLGQMHRLTRSYPRDPAVGDWRGEYEFMVGRCPDEEVLARWRAMHEYLAELPTPADAFGLVHNDLHQWNYTVSGPADRPEITAFDFDCVNYHWFATEIGLAVFHTLWEGPRQTGSSRGQYAHWFLDELLAGYARENTLTDYWVAQVPRFVEYRRLLLFSVFADEWGKSDNAWRREQVATWRREIVAGEPVVDL
jgi:amicoumacin kinase